MDEPGTDYGFAFNCGRRGHPGPCVHRCDPHYVVDEEYIPYYEPDDQPRRGLRHRATVLWYRFKLWRKFG